MVKWGEDDQNFQFSYFFSIIMRSKDYKKYIVLHPTSNLTPQKRKSIVNSLSEKNELE